MAIFGSFEGNLILLAMTLAIFAVYYLSYEFARTIRVSGWASATAGFTFFLVGLGAFQLGYFLELFFLGDVVVAGSLVQLSAYIFLGSMVAFIILTEYDRARHEKHEEQKFYYRDTLVTLIGLAILLPLTILIDFTDILFIFVVIPFVIESSHYLNNFKTLLTIQDKNPTRLFFIGLSIAGFSNFFRFLYFFIDNWVNIVTGIAILIGAMMMTRSWKQLPRLNELNWLLRLNRLIVVHTETSVPLYSYQFRTTNPTSESETKATLDAGGLSGINMLLREILTTKGQVKEIDHSDQKILFAHGNKVVCVLIVDDLSQEARYRIDLFCLTFEQRFASPLSQWNGNISPFANTKDLVWEIFSK